MEEIEESRSPKSVETEEEQQQNVIQFLDSMDTYLTLMDSLSNALRQGWLELASARHSMGASRINSSLFDLKTHTAATTVQLTQHDDDSTMKLSEFKLCKWVSSDYVHCCSGESKRGEDELLKKCDSPQLRQRGMSQFAEYQEKSPTSSGESPTFDTLVQKERSKSLSVFGTLISPKLRTAQLSFETALETLLEIANTRSLMLSAFELVRKEMADHDD